MKNMKKSANSAKYKCRDDRRVVLLLNRNAVVVKKFFEERAGKPSPYIKRRKKQPKIVKYREVFDEKREKECKKCKIIVN